MANSGRADELRWRLAERAATTPRAELRALLEELAERLEGRLELVPPRQGVVDTVLERYSLREQIRMPEGSLSEAIAQVLTIAARRSAGPWLIKPGRPEQIGLVRVVGRLSAGLLEALARWDGEGLLLGSESGVDWMLLNLDRSVTPMRCELLLSPEMSAQPPAPSEEGS